MLSQNLGGRYHLLSHLGGGGFGQTYLAEDCHLPGHPRCVVKQLKPRTIDGISLEAARRLFDAEAEALYQLGSHPQIPQLMAHFEEDEQFYLVQELIEGAVLSDLITDKQPWDEARTAYLITDLLKTLSVVHRHQVIHRDLKPSNLILRHSDQRLVLIDFGSVKQVSTQPLEVEGQMSITIAVGSMGYMPNEQLAGQPCLSSDIYAVGMLAIQLLTGIEPRRLSKDPKTSEVVWRQHATVSSDFADLIDRMVRYDFRQRYDSAMAAQAAMTALKPPSIVDAAAQEMPPPVTAQSLTPERVPANPDALQPRVADLTTLAPAMVIERRANALQADELSVWLVRGDELFAQSRYLEAVDCYSRVLAADEQNGVVWFKQGMAYENSQNFQAAAQAYDRVIQLNPEDYLAWSKKGNALRQLNRHSAALSAYEEVSRLQPHNYWVWHDRGQVLETLERFDDAIVAYDRAIQLQPDFQVAQNSRRRILLRLQRVEQLYQLRYYDEVITACDQTLQENSKDTLAALMRGMALENLGRLPEAALSYHQVVKHQPNDHVAWFRLAEVLMKLDRAQQAAIAYGQVVRIQPHNHWACYQWGQMLERQHNYKAAIAAYNQALKYKEDFEAGLQARQRLLDMLLATAAQPSQTLVSPRSNQQVSNALSQSSSARR
ncbi:MAG: serine/threonine-protein kinase [Cyanobacteria bacterium P01_D01_bin.128]